ncbi:DUF2279 domain-containing protein [Flavobacterium sp.]|uniref:DUF2279 domain-containing protein n=1 Tax=Flavobacterium sp. TaxID=239 RepID=UPI0026317D2D|nr:DUF2279 domain-containing protein [Flavobacterium sp.]MDG2433699.1 DUF2279 domain-containing protein [Flavobacterium sp.]
MLSIGYAQNSLDRFLTPSDTLNPKRKKTVFISEAALGGLTLVGLNQLWYADYPRSNFHFINDNSEWLQMDKVGHFYSTYHLGRLGSEMLQWSGATKKQQLVYGASLGLAFLTVVEVFDGFSTEWGASPGDLIANLSGSALYVGQELVWKEQRITPKFSFHSTKYAALRPNVLGSSLSEKIIKDYNGQTYWLSVNLYSFFKDSKIPIWLNVAVGYGADGMVSGNSENTTIASIGSIERTRQFYLSLDVDLTKIETKSHFLKTFFSVFNSLKIPAPTLEYTPRESFKGHLIYF